MQIHRRYWNAGNITHKFSIYSVFRFCEKQRPHAYFIAYLFLFLLPRFAFHSPYFCFSKIPTVIQHNGRFGSAISKLLLYVQHNAEPPLYINSLRSEILKVYFNYISYIIFKYTLPKTDCKTHF